VNVQFTRGLPDEHGFVVTVGQEVEAVEDDQHVVQLFLVTEHATHQQPERRHVLQTPAQYVIASRHARQQAVRVYRFLRVAAVRGVAVGEAAELLQQSGQSPEQDGLQVRVLVALATTLLLD